MARAAKVRDWPQIVDDFKHELSPKTIKDWAKEEGYNLHLVYGVTRGIVKAKSGTSRTIKEQILTTVGETL